MVMNLAKVNNRCDEYENKVEEYKTEMNVTIVVKLHYLVKCKKLKIVKFWYHNNISLFVILPN